MNKMPSIAAFNYVFPPILHIINITSYRSCDAAISQQKFDKRLHTLLEVQFCMIQRNKFKDCHFRCLYSRSYPEFQKLLLVLFKPTQKQERSYKVGKYFSRLARFVEEWKTVEQNPRKKILKVKKNMYCFSNMIMLICITCLNYLGKNAHLQVKLSLANIDSPIYFYFCYIPGEQKSV